MNRFERFASLYRSAAMVVFNTALLFLVLNIAVYLYYLRVDSATAEKALNPVAQRYGETPLVAVYPGLSREEINDLLLETWTRPYAYEPFTQFKERAYAGHYVNVDDNGFRLTADQGPWPLDPDALNVFLFGGSTTFGYGVKDKDTIASYLQAHLADRLGRTVHVYNFGRGNFYSTQERILFEKLLIGGHVPDLAVFVDGLNDFYFNLDEPGFTVTLNEVFEAGSETQDPGPLSWLPIGRPIQAFTTRMAEEAARSAATQESEEGSRATDGRSIYDDPVVIGRVIDRYLANRKMIEAVAASAGVQPFFVWQPNPMFRYDKRHNLFAGPNEASYGAHSYSKYGYPYMERRVQAEPPGPNFLWSADIQQDRKEPLYLDQVHYTARFSRVIAEHIGDALMERGMTGVSGGADPLPVRP